MIDDLHIAEAVSALREGHLVGFPTETVYGLGADATNDEAVARIFAAKDRPQFNPLIVHVAAAEEARPLAVFDARAEALAETFWPGPLTLVLPRAAYSPVSLLCSAGLDSIAIRMPAHPLMLKLLQEIHKPIAGPSANRSGRVSPTTAAHVREELGAKVRFVLDGGPCRIGLESTVLDLSAKTARLLRPGGIVREALEQVIGPIEEMAPLAPGIAPAGPGMLASHYAPTRPVRLNVLRPEQDQAFLAFGSPPADVMPAAQLSVSCDLTEAAARLFAALRALDRAPFTSIAVMPIPMEGLGIAINDRLTRAAAPRGSS